MSASTAQTAAHKNAAALKIIMGLENEALAAEDLIALKHIAVNRPRDVLQTGHIFWISRHGNKITIDAISSQSTLDKTTPFIQWMTRQLNLRLQSNDLNDLALWEFDNSREETPFTYPFTQALYAPFAPNSQHGGLLFTRETPFKDAEHHLVRRLANIFGLAAMATKRKRRKTIRVGKRLALWGMTALLALISVIPVPMTSLAPAEIVAGSPFIMTAPFDGVIEDIFVPPNTAVESQMPLLRFVDTAYRNDFILAGKEAAIAEAKLRQAAVSSFVSETAKRDIAIAEAEKALAVAQQKYAQDRLEKTTLIAPKEGLAIYSNPADWLGRHVTTGEAIIQIANPSDLRLRIEAPLSMGESLTDGTRVKLFLNNAPLNSFEAQLSSASYYAKPLPGGHMAYEAYADLQLANDDNLPRIGARGVAKIYGRKAPLGYWLLRRPLTLMRQTLGF